MKIIYNKMNLLDCYEDIIVHDCNAQGAFNAGVAKAIAQKYPGAKEIYEESYKSGELKLGQSNWYRNDSDNKLIINAVTQEFYGRVQGVRYVCYDAIRSVMKDVNWLAVSLGERNNMEEGMFLGVAMPKIGAGLGNGDWMIIEKIIEEESTDFQPVVYSLE